MQNITRNGRCKDSVQYPLSLGCVVIKYEKISYFLRDWNLCWASQSELIMYLKVT